MAERPGAAALPTPDAAAAAHRDRVVAALTARIAGDARGWLPFDEFMDFALYAPGLGYYSAGARKFGAAGDFTTAPETTPLFGACLARRLAGLLETLGPTAQLVEYGAGTGALAAALLGELARLGAPLPARYVVVEVSADLRERQRARLEAALAPDLARRVTWLDAPPPGPWRGALIANEVLDALPCLRFVVDARAPDGVSEEGVALDPPPAPGAAADPRAVLTLALRPARPELVGAVRALEARRGAPLPAGYRSEWAPRRDAWLASATEALAEGVALLVDYGMSEREYYADERSDGTLVCHYRHRAHGDVLFAPGVQDLTAWVDFSAVARTAAQHGLALAEYTTQAGFLIAGGIDVVAAEAMAAAPASPPAARLALAGAVRRLVLPGEMGERFRAMTLSRGVGQPWASAAIPDLRYSL